MNKGKGGRITQDNLAKKLYEPSFPSYNGLFKSEATIWSAGKNIPITYVSVSNPSFEVNSAALKCLNTGSYKVTLEGQIETTEETEIKYQGSACTNSEYNQLFLTKRLEAGINQVNWTVILELTRGTEFALAIGQNSHYSGQLVIIKV